MKPYKAKSLKGAEAMVRRQRKQIVQMDAILKTWARERTMLAKLAADTPQFSNPLDVMEAKQLRDFVLEFVDERNARLQRGGAEVRRNREKAMGEIKL